MISILNSLFIRALRIHFRYKINWICLQIPIFQLDKVQLCRKWWNQRIIIYITITLSRQLRIVILLRPNVWIKSWRQNTFLRFQSRLKLAQLERLLAEIILWKVITATSLMSWILKYRKNTAARTSTCSATFAWASKGVRKLFKRIFMIV